MVKILKEKPKEIQHLAARIRQLRQERGYTSQETFAYDHGYTLSYYSRLERGEDVRYSSLLKVCGAFGISLEEFFKGFDFPKPVKKKK